MAALKKSKFIEWFWKVHPRLYKLSGGRIGGNIVGMPVLLLTTLGRKSGELRTVALTYLPRGDAFLVIASYLGEPKHPAWWLNLTANADATVQAGGTTTAVVAREIEGAERDSAWDEVVAANPDYAEYATRTTRRIPVVVLTPKT